MFKYKPTDVKFITIDRSRLFSQNLFSTQNANYFSASASSRPPNRDKKLMYKNKTPLAHASRYLLTGSANRWTRCLLGMRPFFGNIPELS